VEERYENRERLVSIKNIGCYIYRNDDRFEGEWKEGELANKGMFF
jgi:hypothetical protein